MFGVSLKHLVCCWLTMKATCRRECNRCLIWVHVLGWCWLPYRNNHLCHLCTMSWSSGTHLHKHCTPGISHSWAHMHHTGSQENEVGPEEQEETQEQELLRGPEPWEDLHECPDHKPSMFEKGKPRSILSLPILANLISISCLFNYVAFKW